MARIKAPSSGVHCGVDSEVFHFRCINAILEGAKWRRRGGGGSENSIRWRLERPEASVFGLVHSLSQWPRFGLG